MPKLLVFSSGTKEAGGSGFENLVLASRNGILNADIVGVVSNHAEGGVKARADKLGVPFIHFTKPWDAESYQRIAAESGADFFALSGWLKLVNGLDANTPFNSKTVFNIHPGPLPQFGGDGMYGHFVLEAVMNAYKNGEASSSGVSMHFVTEKYDEGPIFFLGNVPINPGDTAETLAARVNEREHYFQPRITNLVVNGEIKWDGKNPSSLVLPANYSVEQ